MIETDEGEIVRLLQKIKELKQTRIRLEEIIVELGEFYYLYGGNYHCRPTDLVEITGRILNDCRLTLAKLRGE